MSDFTNIRYKLFHNDTPCICSVCGSSTSVELHHIKPKSLGGSDTIENLQPLCTKCHQAIHNKDRSYLTKIGQEKSKKKVTVPLINKVDLLLKIQNSIDDGLAVADVIDIIIKTGATQREWISRKQALLYGYEIDPNGYYKGDPLPKY